MITHIIDHKVACYTFQHMCYIGRKVILVRGEGQLWTGLWSWRGGWKGSVFFAYPTKNVVAKLHHLFTLSDAVKLFALYAMVVMINKVYSCN